MKNLTYKLFILLVLFSVCGSSVFAQKGKNKKVKEIPITVSGNVKNDMGLNMDGVTITVQESFVNTISNDMGDFTITVPKSGSVLVLRAPYYKEVLLTITNDDFLKIVMEEAEEGDGVGDVVYMPWYETSKRDVTAAISSVGSNDLRITPVPSLINAVSAKVPGLGVRQIAGLPGYDNGYFRIRGMRTLEDGGFNTMDKGSVYTPLVIVDGFERSFAQLDAEEIESFSILKDAAATALYGMRGAKGVILVTTKRGQLNRRTINLEMSSGIITPTRLPNFLNSYDYATMYNEAKVNDGLSPVYTDEDLQKYKDHSSPLTHPDVDYYDEFIKKAAFQAKTSLSMSGGNKTVRYYVFMGYTTQQGLFKHNDENPDFKTKIRYNRYNLRSNVDVNLAKWLVLSTSIAGRIEDRRYPYEDDSAIMDVLSTYPPNAFPIQFKGIEPTLNKEITMLGGNSLYKKNPLGLLSYDGYNESTRRYYQVTGKFKGDLSDFITPGLSFEFAYNMDGYNAYRVEKQKNFLVWEYSESADGTPNYTSYGVESSLATEGYYDVDRMNGLDAILRYERNFGKHGISAFVSYYQEKIEPRQTNYSDQKWQAFQYRANYSYDNRYYLDFVGSYSGSDKFFYTNNKKLFYPAVSGAWIISSEKFMKSTSKWLDYLKLRASWGISGNDQYTFTDINGNAERYPARDRWWTYSNQQYFGTALTSVVFVKEGRASNKDITTEKGRMINIGLEGAFFRHRLNFALDLWKEKRYDIFTVSEGSLPMVLGMLSSRLPISNDGRVDSKGYEFSLGWSDKIGKFSYNINGYVDWSTNKIINMAEPQRDYPNLVQTGHGIRNDFGLIALGLFKDWEDVNNSPVQSFGSYQPGDIKYKDINGDNIIDSNDFTCLGDGATPRLNYALNIGLAYKNIDLSLVFQGVGLRKSYLNNNAMWAFYGNSKVSDIALGRYVTYADGTNNWETANYPRLTTVENNNNWRCSTFWMRDASYIRLKNLEIGYTIPKRLLSKANIYGLRLYLNAYNVFTISDIKSFDPEDTAAAISEYPMTRVFNFGVSLKF